MNEMQSDIEIDTRLKHFPGGCSRLEVSPLLSDAAEKRGLPLSYELSVLPLCQLLRTV